MNNLKRSTAPSPVLGPLVVTLRPRALAGWLLAILALLILAGLLSNRLARANGGWFPDGGMRRLALHGEYGFPKLFNGALLTLGAAGFGLCAALTPPGHPLRRRWAVTAAAFLLILADEMVLIHAALAEPVAAHLVRLGVSPGLAPHAWIGVAALLAAAVGLLWLPALGQLPARTRALFISAALLYGGAATGGAVLARWAGQTGGPFSWRYLLAGTLAETLEMGALILLVYALADYVARRWGGVVWRLQPAAAGAPLPALTATPRQIVTVLGVILAVFSLLYILVFIIIRPSNPGAVTRELLARLNLDIEVGLTTVFSTLLLSFAALLLSLIALEALRRRDRLWLRWVPLAAAFAFLAADEMTALHEILSQPLRNRLGLTGLWGFAWYIAVVPLVLVFGLFCLELLWKLPRRTRALFVLSGAVYVGAAAGIEMFGSLFKETLGLTSLPYLIEAATEETLEMTGALIFIYALLDHLARHWGSVVVTLPAETERVLALSQPSA